MMCCEADGMKLKNCPASVREGMKNAEGKQRGASITRPQNQAVPPDALNPSPAASGKSTFPAISATETKEGSTHVTLARCLRKPLWFCRDRNFPSSDQRTWLKRYRLKKKARRFTRNGSCVPPFRPKIFPTSFQPSLTVLDRLSWEKRLCQDTRAGEAPTNAIRCQPGERNCWRISSAQEESGAVAPVRQACAAKPLRFRTD